MQVTFTLDYDEPRDHVLGLRMQRATDMWRALHQINELAGGHLNGSGEKLAADDMAQRAQNLALDALEGIFDEVVV